MKNLMMILVSVLLVAFFSNIGNAKPSKIDWDPQVNLDCYFNPYGEDGFYTTLTLSPAYIELTDDSTFEVVLTGARVLMYEEHHEPVLFTSIGFRITWTTRHYERFDRYE